MKPELRYVEINGDMNEALKEFNSKLRDDEKIVHIVPHEKYLFITVQKVELHNLRGMNANLLTDQLKRGSNRT